MRAPWATGAGAPAREAAAAARTRLVEAGLAGQRSLAELDAWLAGLP